MAQIKKVFTTFKERTLKAVDYHTELMLAVHLKRRQAILESILAEQFVLTIAVMWEAYVNDLLLAYVIKSPGVCLKNLQSRIKKGILDKYGSSVAKTVVFKWPRELDKSRALAILDPDGWNITARSAKALSERANDLLIASHAKKFFLNSDDREFIDALLCLRNYLSHHSKNSRRMLLNSILNIKSPSTNAALKGPFFSAGSYLKKDNGLGETRAKFIARRLIEIGEKLS